eukprot:gb/GEZJ01001000.1/.p1 GENE.gb/GEZJ01001000.1/~~gb/GEZJ01001000.1/.p1  ORF type:complete len:566 (+),score=70.54 gb/GEZJ01001000.1/:2459-4156(+)
MAPLLASFLTALLTSSRPSHNQRLAQPQSAPKRSLRQQFERSANGAKQHPVVALAAAYALFLIGRENAVAKRMKRGRAPRQLAVSIDLFGSDHVEASLLHGAPTRPAEPHRKEERALLAEAHLTAASDMRTSKRDIAIVTTAAIPWMTGTSVNPALRALYLAKDGHRVTLVVPWIPTEEQQLEIFSKGSPSFSTQQQQREYITQWGSRQVPVHFDVLFYDGVYAPHLGSILPVGAVTDVIDAQLAKKDVCILEEPEHLTWHHSGKIWTHLFNYVVGIIHTNYIEYARGEDYGPQKAAALLLLNMWVSRSYCHRIIKLSDAVQLFPNSVTCNTHGVRETFINIGEKRSGPFPRGAYFMGKVLWAKGYGELINCMIKHYELNNEPLHIDFYGAGPDVPGVREKVDTHPALSAVKFDARVADPASEWLQGYKVFVNASRSDVVCTATAEALAMGKLVVCLEHPSNEFFSTFPNCKTYRTPEEFSSVFQNALQSEPLPLSVQDSYRFTWEAATERLYDAMRMPLNQSNPSKVGAALASAHKTLSKIYPQPGKKMQTVRSRESLRTRSNS